MRVLLASGFFLAFSGHAVKLRADSYQNGDNGVRLAKQRLLSMDPSKPGIRYRVGDQLSKLTDVFTAISTLEKATKVFQKALSQVSGVIDIPGQNDGLVPQMKKANQGVKKLDSQLSKLHKSVTKQVQNLYNQANKMPQTLTSNLRKSLNNLVTAYNQQILNQVHSLDRQRESALSSALQDTKTLNRTITNSQRSQLASVRKLIAEILNDKVDVLSQTADLNSKFQAASAIVDTALAAVKEKSGADLNTVQNIVDQNKQTLTDYIQQQGSTWTQSLQALIEKAAKQTSKRLNSMAAGLSQQFAVSQKQAQSSLSDADSLIDSSVKSISQTFKSIQKRFNLSIANATAVTDATLQSLQQPIQDINNQVTAASNMMSSVEQSAQTGISSINSNATAFTSQMVASFQAQAQNVTSNPGFSQITQMANNVYNSAQSSMQAAQASASTRVAALQNQMGSNDETVGKISQSLQETIAQQTSDFKTQTQVQTANMEASVTNTGKQLSNLAQENAAQIDDTQADADSQLASTTDRVMNNIAQGHDSALSMVDSVSGQIDTAVNNTNSLIANSFAGALSDSSDLLDQSASLGASANGTAAQIAAVQAGLASQMKQVKSQISAASGSIANLQQQGSNAVEQFSHDASAAASGAVSEFTQEANAAVDGFSDSTKSQLNQLQTAQQTLAEATNMATNQSAVLQAQLSTSLGQAKNMLNSIRGNSSLTNTVLQGQLSSALQDFKSGSASAVADLKAGANEQLRSILSDLNGQVSGASTLVKNQTQGLVTALAQMGDYVSEHSRKLQTSVGNATGAVGDFSALVDGLVAQIGSLNDGLKLYYQNTSQFVDSKLDDTEQYLNESQADAQAKIDQTWHAMSDAMASVNDSTLHQIEAFKNAVNASIFQSDSIVQNFTDYLNAMVDFERRSAANRLAIQRGLLASIINHASVANASSNASSADMIARLQAVLATASGAVGSANSSLTSQQAAQDALINSFGVSTASSVQDLLKKLSDNSDAFSSAVSDSSSSASSDSGTMLKATGQGEGGIVSLANGIADSVDMALNETQSQIAQSQLAMAALSSETNGLSNITQSQLTAVLQAMMDSQVMYSGQLNSARKNNSNAIATISGVISDFVTLVNETLAQSNDMISAVDANYTNASEVLSAKMDTILGFISREASSISDSASTSGQNLKAMLTRNGAMEDGIRGRLEKLSEQQDSFASDVHTQLQGLVARLSQDTSNMNSARQAASAKLVSTLQAASSQFASQAAQWQSERLQQQQTQSSSPSALIDVGSMSDHALIQDVARHLSGLLQSS